MVQAIEEASAPLLSSYFSLATFWFCCFPWDYLAVFFPPKLPGFALRVIAPLIVLAVSKMVCCLLSVGSLLLNAASGTPEHLDQSIGLSWPYFPHCPCPRCVTHEPSGWWCSVWIQTPAAAVRGMSELWWGGKVPVHGNSKCGSGVLQGLKSLIHPHLQVTSFCQ